MTKDEIIKLALEAGFANVRGGLMDNGELSDYWDCWPKQLERFAALVAAAERDCALAELREKVGLAYGYLWCVNNEPGAPHQMPPERMAYEARKLLRDTMTHHERGEFINRVLPLVRGGHHPSKGNP